ncbi:serine hydrolase [Levilactobacillus yonginensis]|uniref:serine hydrolase n=1 Tax=Levilactobacillus yonginensis TaxID=1054041 RepID=UPI00345C6EB0
MKKWVLMSLSALAVVALISGCQKKTSNSDKESVDQATRSSTKAQSSRKQTGSSVGKQRATPVKTKQSSPFKQIVAQTMGRLKGQNAVYVQPVGSAAYQWHVKSQKAASDIKLFILATVYQQVQTGKFNLTATYTLKDSDKVGGTGSLQGMAAGTRLTNQELLKYMMTVSDNTATNVVIRKVGGFDAVNQEIKRLGATQTVLQRKMMDQKSLAAGKDNMTSARDLGQLLVKLWQHQLVSKSADTAMLKLMAANTNHSKLPKLLPSDRQIYNKTGEFDTYGVENDAAIFVKGKRAVIVVALSQGGTLAEQVAAMNQLGKQVDAVVFK